MPRALQTSYELQQSVAHPDWVTVRRSIGRYRCAPAIAYCDFDDDGDEDIFVAPISGTASPIQAEMYLNDGGGSYRLDNRIFGSDVPELVHARKALTGDYNREQPHGGCLLAHRVNRAAGSAGAGRHPPHHSSRMEREK